MSKRVLLVDDDKALVETLIETLESHGFKCEFASDVKQGLEAYSAGGAKAAIETWIKGSGLEGSKAAVAQANVMRQVEDFYGKYEGYDIVDVRHSK